MNWCRIFGHQKRKVIIRQPDRWTYHEAWTEWRTTIETTYYGNAPQTTPRVTPIFHPAYESGTARMAWTCKRRGCEGHGEKDVTLRRNPQRGSQPVDTE